MPNRADNDAFLIGFAAGLRSATPLATVAGSAHRGWLDLPRPFNYLGGRPVAALLGLAGIGEWVVDKLPFTPSRLEPRSLVVRAGLGAVAGMAVQASNGQPPWRGILPGKLGALAGSYAGYQARSLLSHVAEKALERHGLSPAAGRFAVAVAEDAAAVGLSILALRLRERTTSTGV